MDYLTGHVLSETFHMIKGFISRETKPSPESRSTVLSPFDSCGKMRHQYLRQSSLGRCRSGEEKSSVITNIEKNH